MPTKPLHQSPFSAGQGTENKIENDSQVEIRQFTKAKVKVRVHTIKEKKTFHSLISHQQMMSGYLLESKAPALGVVVP